MNDPPPSGEACEACRDNLPMMDNGHLVERFWMADGSGPWYLGEHVEELHALLARKVAEVAEFREKLNAVIEFFWPTAQDDHVKQDILERALCALRASSERKP